MTDHPAPGVGSTITEERLRAIVQDSHISFLIGAGTSSQFFAPLGDVEEALVGIDQVTSRLGPKREIARASVQALFFDRVIKPNVELVRRSSAALPVLQSYARFGQALNRLLLARRSTLLGKQVSLYTTNIDLAVEVAFERLGLLLNDGFRGRFETTFDPGALGTLTLRESPRYGQRSEVPVFDLHKLHGSVGWRWADDGTDAIRFDSSLAQLTVVQQALDGVRDELVALDDPTSLDAQAIVEAAGDRPVSGALASFSAAYGRLVIVNPEKTKFATTVMTETYYELIRRFANQLERETTVLFVHGFSFRDEHLRKIVLRAARTNPTLQVIVFAYDHAAASDYAQIIPEIDVPNGNIEVVAPDGQSATRFTLDEVVDRFLLPLSQDLPVGPEEISPRIQANTDLSVTGE